MFAGPLNLPFVLTQRPKRRLNDWKDDVLTWFRSGANYRNDRLTDYTFKPLTDVCVNVDLKVYFAAALTLPLTFLIICSDGPHTHILY